MNITKVDVIPVNIPFSSTVKWAEGQMPGADNVMVKITAEDGTFGVGEATPRIGIYGETQQSIYHVIRDHLAPMLIGEDSFGLERIWKKMDFVVWNPTAKGAIDIALHDLNARVLGVPLNRLLGGPVRDRVALSWTMSGTYGDPRQQVEEAARKAGEGYRTFKVKTGHGDPEADIRLLREMKDACPEDCAFYIDANMVYSREQAYHVLNELKDVIVACEEPIAATDREGRLALARALPVPILSDESTVTVDDVYREIQLGAVSRIGIKLPRTGITLSRKIINLAECANLPCQISTQLESDLGSATCIQLAAAFGQISLACEIAFFEENFSDSLITEPLRIENGHLLLPEGPGSGVDVDWDKVARYAVAV